MEHISQVLQDTLITKGISPAPELSPKQRAKIQKDAEWYAKYTHEPHVVRLCQHIEALLTELERKEGEE